MNATRPGQSGIQRLRQCGAAIRGRESNAPVMMAAADKEGERGKHQRRSPCSGSIRDTSQTKCQSSISRRRGTTIRSVPRPALLLLCSALLVLCFELCGLFASASRRRQSPRPDSFSCSGLYSIVQDCTTVLYYTRLIHPALPCPARTCCPRSA